MLLHVLQINLDPFTLLDASFRDHHLQVLHLLLQSTKADVVVSSFLLILAGPASPFAALLIPFDASSFPLLLIWLDQLFKPLILQLTSAYVSYLPYVFPFQFVPFQLFIAFQLLRLVARHVLQLQLLHHHHRLELEAALILPRLHQQHP